MNKHTQAELEKAGHVVCGWGDSVRKLFGGEPLPKDYFCYDIESSGFSAAKGAVMLEWGHCLVRDGKVDESFGRMNILLNWFDCKPAVFEPGQLEYQLERIRNEMRLQNRGWHLTKERIRDEGIDPLEAIQFAYDMIKTMHDQHVVLVTQNGLRFDNKMLEFHFKNELNIPFEFDQTRVLDVGCIEKAGQMLEQHHADAIPRPDETLGAYFHRINYKRMPGVKWNAEHCVEKYGLPINPHHMHSAAEDSYILHLLVERFRGLADAVSKNRTVPRVSVPPVRSPAVVVGRTPNVRAGPADVIPESRVPAVLPASRQRQRSR